MLKEKDVIEIRGKNVKYNGRPGFIAVEIKKGLSIKPLDDLDDDDPDAYLYCFDYRYACAAFGKRTADKMFRSRIALFKSGGEFNSESLEGLYHYDGVAHQGACALL